MPVRYHDLKFAGFLQPESCPANRLHLVHARGRATQLDVPNGWPSLWMPLAGALRVESRDVAWGLSPKTLLVWHDGGLRNCGQQPSWFLALCGPEPAWRHHLASVHGKRTTVDMLLSEQSRRLGEARRLLVRLARLARNEQGENAPVDALIDACCSSIIEHQWHLQGYLARCGGRTERRRLQTLHRLLRVRHLIDNSANTRLDLPHLGRLANYSPWHLARAYRDVFGETPFEHATRVRLAQAMAMVRDSQLSVGEITEVLGFESQSTFCRAFKQTFGMTTTQVRGLSQPLPAQARRAG